ncbi:LysR family transcriptional regulator [Vibrio natriegens]|uniref:LysR family transcriptional regulator n=1 Tax=Vibrio TaxID=662 RepID=UPI000305B5D7|nr:MULTISPECIES: LysR family transcriptional regulator [Vibrio]ANQ23420.1 LysR family transcriptional regulator [Vibrio natriegens]AXT73390.1 LysR family transcriptional regulator [Vibrio sp. dhg]MCG9702616.1 LysR family transcriptional regulator [Vibrio natriegens]
MDRLTAAKVFIDVVYSGSFTATAERLEMSRPMVTRYVDAMENWLQIRLLHRTTRKVSLTTAGERSVAQIERWLKQADSLTSNIVADGELAGKIRLASSASFGFSQLIPAVHSFMQLHPKVDIDLDLQDSVSDLTEERIDLAIRIASNPDPALIGKPIADCDSVLVAAPEYLKKQRVISQPSDLSDHDCLGYKNFERRVWHLSLGEQFESVSIHCRLTCNEATALLHGALQGMGVALLPTYLTTKYVQLGELEIVLPDWKPNRLHIYALYSSRKHLSPAVRAFIDHSEQYFKRHPW